MRIIGVVGQTGSGKGELCRRLAARGYLHLDTDRIYHTLLTENQRLQADLAAAFGADIAGGDGIDRKKLAAKVFGKGKDKQLKRLNRIAHRYVCAEVIRQITAAKATDCKGVLIDAPLLFHARLDRLCDAIVYVYAAEEVRLSRIIARDGLSKEEALSRIRAGQPLSGARLARCTYFVENNGDQDLDGIAAKLAEALGGSTT